MLTKVLLTHAYIEHAGATHKVSSFYNISIEGSYKEDQFWIDLLPEQKECFGFNEADFFEPDR